MSDWHDFVRTLPRGYSAVVDDVIPIGAQIETRDVHGDWLLGYARSPVVLGSKFPVMFVSRMPDGDAFGWPADDVRLRPPAVR